MHETKLKPGFYYDGDRVVDANGKPVALEVAAEEPVNEKLTPDTTEDRTNLDAIIAVVFSRLSGLERLDGESAPDYIERAATGYKNLAEQVQYQRTQFDASYKEATDEIDRLTAESATAKTDLEAAKANATSLTTERDGLKSQVDKLTKDLATAQKKNGANS